MVLNRSIITVIGTIVTEKIVEPRLGKYTGDATVEESAMTVSKEEQRGLRFAGIATLLSVAGLAALVVPANGFLRGTDAGIQGILKSPFMDSMVLIIALVFAIAGIAYGVGAKVVKNDKDVMNLMGKSMASMGLHCVSILRISIRCLLQLFKLRNNHCKQRCRDVKSNRITRYSISHLIHLSCSVH